MPMEEGSCEDEFINIQIDDPLELVTSKITLAHLFLVPQILLQKNSKGYIPKISNPVFASPPGRNIKIYLQVESFLN